MPIPNWIAEEMQQNVQKLTAKQNESDKMASFRSAVNELMRDYNVSALQRVEFINAVAKAATVILK